QSDNTENIASPPPLEPQNTPEQSIEPTEDPGYQVPVTSPQQPQPKKKWLKLLIVFVAIVVLAVGGWLIYKQLTKNDEGSSSVQSKDIQQLSVGISSAD